MHVSDYDVGCIGGAFATFLAQSDHKAVVVAITARVRSKRGHRHRVCPEMLSCDASTNALRRQPEAIPKDAEDWWDVSASLIRGWAAHYSPARTGNSKGVSQVVSMLYRSSFTRVCGEGWDLLRDRGIEPPTHAIAYKALSQIVDNLHQDFQGQTVLGKLQDLLTHDEEFDLTCSERVNQVYRPMKQLTTQRPYTFHLTFLCGVCKTVSEVRARPQRAMYSARDHWRLKEPADARIACSKVAFETEQPIPWNNVCFLSTNLIFTTSLIFEHLQIPFSDLAK